MTYGFLGAGNMASAIIKGMVAAGVSPGEIYIFNRTWEKAEALKTQLGVKICENRQELSGKDVVVIAVKPQVLDGIIEEFSLELKGKNPLIVSLAAGKTLEFLSKKLGQDKSIVRVMPNINAKVQLSTTGYCGSQNTPQEALHTVEHIFGTIGSITPIPESLFPVFSAIAGSAPAFMYLYIDTVARAAQKAGMPRKEALDIAANTVLGSAKMILESKEHPVALIDQVCSPGGTTIEGIASLKENGFENSVLKAVDAVIEKDRKIVEASK